MGREGPFQEGANGLLARPGSLLLFGGCTVGLNIFRVGYDVMHTHCKSKLEVIFPSIDIIFIGVQVTGLSRPWATRHSLPIQAACAPQPMPGNSLIGKYLRGPEYVHTHHSPPRMPACVYPLHAHLHVLH